MNYLTFVLWNSTASRYHPLSKILALEHEGCKYSSAAKSLLINLSFGQGYEKNGPSADKNNSFAQYYNPVDKEAV
jgi:hypothetical protein